jgi:hypothetical protein
MKKATLIITAILLVVMATSSFAVPPLSARQLEPGVRLDFVTEQPVGNPYFSDFYNVSPATIRITNEVLLGAETPVFDFLSLDDDPTSRIQVNPNYNLDIEDLSHERSKIQKRAYTNQK